MTADGLPLEVRYVSPHGQKVMYLADVFDYPEAPEVVNRHDGRTWLLVDPSDHLSKKELRREGWQVLRAKDEPRRVIYPLDDIEELDLSDGSGE